MTASATDYEESQMSNTFGPGQVSMLKPNFLNVDIVRNDLPSKPPTGSIFNNKRHTVQPHSQTREFTRSLINHSDPLKMSLQAKKAMSKAGCHKEQ